MENEASPLLQHIEAQSHLVGVQAGGTGEVRPTRRRRGPERRSEKRGPKTGARRVKLPSSRMSPRQMIVEAHGAVQLRFSAVAARVSGSWCDEEHLPRAMMT